MLTSDKIVDGTVVYGENIFVVVLWSSSIMMCLKASETTPIRYGLMASPKAYENKI